MMTSVEELAQLAQLATECDLLAYDCTVPIDDRLILIKLAEDLREALRCAAEPKAKAPKLVARPKKPSAKEEIAKAAPKLLDLADAMARLILDEEPQRVAREYIKARGLKV